MDEILERLKVCLESGKPFVFIAEQDDGSYFFTGPASGEWISEAADAVKEQVETDERSRPN
jgi:hypothetical protein